MRWTVLTLFPLIFDSICSTGVLGKAIKTGLIKVNAINLRDFAENKHQQVDDAPFGGGVGMVLKVEPIARAIEHVRTNDHNAHVVLLTPQGHLLSQRRIVELTYYNHVVLLCGRYEGVDERVRAMVDEELSIGDYVLACGEPAAWVVIDGVSRLVPGVMGSQESSVEESHSNSGLLEYPQYTRPREFHGLKVPEVLLNGNHAMIKHWRTQQSMLRTLERRPDIFKKSQ